MIATIKNAFIFLALTASFFVSSGVVFAGTPSLTLSPARYYKIHTIEIPYSISNESEGIGQVRVVVNDSDTYICGTDTPDYAGQTSYNGTCTVGPLPHGDFVLRLEVDDQSGNQTSAGCGIMGSQPCTTIDSLQPSADAPNASVNTDNTINLAFNKPTDPTPSSGLWWKVIRTPDWNGADANEAAVKALQFSASSGNTFYYTTTGSSVTFRDWWVSPGTTYRYKLLAFDNAGNSVDSPQSNSVTTQAPPPATPGSPSNGSRIPSGTPGTGTPTPTQPDSDGDGIPDSEEQPEEEPKPEEEVKGAEENPRNFVGVAIGVAAVLAALGGALIYALRRRMKEFEALGFDEEMIESDSDVDTKK